MLYMCHIGGWLETFGFGATEEQAIRTAMKRWKQRCAPDVKRWTRAQINDWCGLSVHKIEAGCYYDN